MWSVFDHYFSIMSGYCSGGFLFLFNRHRIILLDVLKTHRFIQSSARDGVHVHTAIDTLDGAGKPFTRRRFGRKRVVTAFSFHVYQCPFTLKRQNKNGKNCVASMQFFVMKPQYLSKPPLPSARIRTGSHETLLHCTRGISAISKAGSRSGSRKLCFPTLTQGQTWMVFKTLHRKSSLVSGSCG